MSELTFKDFIDFFQAKKNGTYRCTFCGSEHFYPAMDVRATDPGDLRIHLAPPPGIVETGNHAFYAIVCTNCGRTDLFHKNTVLGWKAARHV